MKRFGLLLSIVMTFAPSIQTNNATRNLFETVTGKLDTNVFTLQNELKECGYTSNDSYTFKKIYHYNSKSIESLHTKVKDEQKKNKKAIADLLIALTVSQLITVGLQETNATKLQLKLDKAVTISGLTLGCLITEQLLLGRMDSKLNEIKKALEEQKSTNS